MNLMQAIPSSESARMPPKRVDPAEVKRKMRLDYIGSKGDQVAKALDGIANLLSNMRRRQVMTDSLLQEAANLIQRQFRLRYVMIGVKSPDGMYRYSVHSGMREDTWGVYRKKVYKASDFALHVPDWYSGAEISRLTRAFLEEENPLGEEFVTSANRPALLSMKRDSPDDSLEADYIDTLIMGTGDELLGWIEYTGTVTGKMPDSTAIRCIEVVAAALAVALSRRN